MNEDEQVGLMPEALETAQQLINARAEIERLRALCDPDYDKAFLVAYRAHIIEECARVADGFGYNMDIAKMLAAAIRALKDKP